MAIKFDRNVKNIFFKKCKVSNLRLQKKAYWKISSVCINCKTFYGFKLFDSKIEYALKYRYIDCQNKYI